MNVLIVEDDIAAAETLSEFLVAKGFNCTVETSGKTAMKNLGTAIDAAIMDIKLGEGPDGLMLTEKLKKLNPNALVIVTTGQDISKMRIESFEKGADFFLAKPIDLNFLTEQVNKLVLPG